MEERSDDSGSWQTASSFRILLWHIFPGNFGLIRHILPGNLRARRVRKLTASSSCSAPALVMEEKARSSDLRIMAANGPVGATTVSSVVVQRPQPKGLTMNALDTDRLLTVKEAAQSLGVHPNWVYREAAAGRLPSVLLGSQTPPLPPGSACELPGRLAA